MSEARKIRVQVKVAVDHNGEWSAGGWGYKGGENEVEFGDLIDSLEPGEARYILTAELAVPPKATEVAAAVEDVTPSGTED